jgi:hypothetical protein
VDLAGCKHNPNASVFTYLTCVPPAESACLPSISPSPPENRGAVLVAGSRPLAAHYICPHTGGKTMTPPLQRPPALKTTCPPPVPRMPFPESVLTPNFVDPRRSDSRLTATFGSIFGAPPIPHEKTVSASARGPLESTWANKHALIVPIMLCVVNRARTPPEERHKRYCGSHRGMGGSPATSHPCPSLRTVFTRDARRTPPLIHGDTEPRPRFPLPPASPIGGPRDRPTVGDF